MPRNSDMVPMVTTMAGIWNRVMIAPLASPASNPVANPISTNTGTPPPACAASPPPRLRRQPHDHRGQSNDGGDGQVDVARHNDQRHGQRHDRLLAEVE